MSLSTLCQRCALCCDGSLFTHVPLRQAEVAAARRRGLDLLERPDGSTRLRQRCAALEGDRCAIYPERPDCCREYRCLLAAGLGEGEVSLEEALAVVGQARALITSGGRERAAGFLDRHFRGRQGRPSLSSSSCE